MAKSDDLASVRATYDTVAESYATSFLDELAGRPLERGLLSAFAELTSVIAGPIADVGCGPGHVTRFLADHGARVFGVDLSAGMVAAASARFPDLEFRVGSMTDIDAADASWAGAVVFYSVIHLRPEARRRAFAELARVIRPGGWLLVSFHVSMAGQEPGSSVHLDRWFDKQVDLTGYFLAPTEVSSELASVGFSVRARLDREPMNAAEPQSCRCYLLATRS